MAMSTVRAADHGYNRGPLESQGVFATAEIPLGESVHLFVWKGIFHGKICTSYIYIHFKLG